MSERYVFIRELPTPCAPFCAQRKLGIFIIRDGRLQVRRYCQECGDILGSSLSHKGVDFRLLPVIASNVAEHAGNIESAKAHVQNLIDAGVVWG